MYFDRLVHLIGVVSGQHSMVSRRFSNFHGLISQHGHLKKKRSIGLCPRLPCVVKGRDGSGTASSANRPLEQTRGVGAVSRHRPGRGDAPSGRETTTAQLAAAGRRREGEREGSMCTQRAKQSRHEGAFVCTRNEAEARRQYHSRLCFFRVPTCPPCLQRVSREAGRRW